MPNKLDPKVYLDAAVTVVDGSESQFHYMSCLAIQGHEQDPDKFGYGPHTQAYRDLFMPPDVEFKGGYWGKRREERYQLQRSIALCLMAEMARDGSL